MELLHQVEEVKALEEKQGAEVFRLTQQVRDRERLHETSTDASRARATRLHLIIRDLRWVLFLTPRMCVVTAVFQ